MALSARRLAATGATAAAVVGLAWALGLRGFGDPASTPEGAVRAFVASAPSILSAHMSRNEHGRGPLHHAAQMNRLAMVRLLLELGADVHATDDVGRTALTVAAAVKAGPDLLELLQAAGATFDLLAALTLGRYDLAERMIRLSGLEPGRDVEIVFTGTRPGERLHEILFAHDEPTAEIGISGVVAARPVRPSIETMRTWLGELRTAVERDERGAISRILREAVPDFRKEAV